MNKNILLPFTLSSLMIALVGCGGGSTTINEDPTQGGGNVTSNASCKVTDADCLEFQLDYPVAGLNFDCSGDQFNHYATASSSNSVTGACKLGDNVTFYIQGDSSKRISFGTVKLDDISKTKVTAVPPHLSILDIAQSVTGSAATELSVNDPTIRVAMALVKIFQTVGLERNNNVVGDVQQTEITKEKRDQLSVLTQNITPTELINGTYANIIKPWLDVSRVSDQQAYDLVVKILNQRNAGIIQADLPIAKAGGDGSSFLGNTNTVRPDGFFGCNRSDLADCVKSSNNLIHSMSTLFALSDRQGYTFGYAVQWRGAATIRNNLVVAPYVLTTKAKPKLLVMPAQDRWLNVLSREINANQPLRLSISENPNQDLQIYQGKWISDYAIAGTEALYKQYLKLTANQPGNPKHYGLWRQTVGTESFNGSLDMLRVNPPSSYLVKDVFKTKNNVASGQNYIFPLYATLTFRSDQMSPIDLGVVIDESGDIRTDIKQSATATDMSGDCGVVSDRSLIDNFGVQQYRIGSTGAAASALNDKSISIRVILADGKFGKLNGAMLGLNIGADASGSAKINLSNLLSGQATGINLTTFGNTTAQWSNVRAAYQLSYNELYDRSTEQSELEAPTAEERELAKYVSGSVTIRVADQSKPACQSIKTKS